MYLGFDIGGTKCAVCLGTADGVIIDRRSFPTEEPKGPAQTITRLFAAADELVRTHAARPLAVGIACGSPLDPEAGIIQSPANLPSWKDVAIVAMVKQRLGIPAFLENDANAGALAEWWFGAGRGARNMVFMTFGTGMGAGLILDSRLYRGTNVYAGEVGHLRLAPYGPVGCRKAGSFEGFCSGGGMAQVARCERQAWEGPTVLPEQPTAKEVGLAAQAGDALALHILTLTGRYLGHGLAIVLDLLNPQVVVLGSIFVRCERFLRPAMDEVLRVEALAQTYSVCRIVPAQLGEAIGDVAAISIAHDALSRLSKGAHPGA
jgi:glucokinase